MIKKVLTDSQYEMIKKEEVNPKEITMFDTLRVAETKSGEPLEYILFRISFKEVDSNKREKYHFDESTNEYKVIYSRTPIIYAYGKQMRILLHMGENAPVKIVYEQVTNSDNPYYRVICIQDQRTGKL